MRLINPLTHARPQDPDEATNALGQQFQFQFPSCLLRPGGPTITGPPFTPASEPPSERQKNGLHLPLAASSTYL